jgi:hypothetical protein
MLLVEGSPPALFSSYQIFRILRLTGILSAHRARLGYEGRGQKYGDFRVLRYKCPVANIGSYALKN